MTDLQIAKSRISGDITVCLVKGKSVVVSARRGVAPLIELCENENSYVGYSAADKIVGKAAALLYVYMGVKAVYAEVLSVAAENVLQAFGIAYEYGKKVDYIINRTGDGRCPMEQAVAEISSPADALIAVKQKLKSLTN